jgi:acyl-CoA synthetase (AMP-forming)/AMP-acid ligase II/serine acetyltransferase/acyl carrier protein
MVCMYPGEYDASKVKEWAGESQFRAWRADLARFRKWGHSGWVTEGFWALTVYRAQRGLRPHRGKWWARAPGIGLSLARKAIDVVTHIHLDEEAEIGPGLLIPHSGPVRVHAEAKIGADCALLHVTTIGAGTRPGAAHIGDHVMVGCHAAILGPVRIGDSAMIASSSLVLTDVPSRCTAIGVPARLISTMQEQEASATTAPSVPSTEPAIAYGAAVVPPQANTFDVLAAKAKRHPDAPALTYVRHGKLAQRQSYAALYEDAARAANTLHRELSAEEPVLIFSKRSPACVALMLGAMGDGRAFTCLNPRWRWPQVRRVLKITGARHLFLDAEGRAMLNQGASAAERAEIEVIDIEDPALFAARPHATHAGVPPSRTRIGCLLFTSGSTGEPKAVSVSEADLCARAAAEVQFYGLRADDVLLNLLPYSFDVGLNQIMAAVHAGACTVISDSWLPADVCDTVRAYGVTGIPCVPSIWQDFINLEVAFDTRDAHRSLRFITVSGGDLPPNYLEKLPGIAKGVAIIKTYGQSEAFRACALPPADFAQHKNTVGKPFPGVSLCIVRKDGSLAMRNEVGELVHMGLGVMNGYLQDAEQTAKKLRPAPTDKSQLASYSGDNAFMDEEGFVHVVGRDDQMLKLNGNRVYPSEVRNLLCDVPEVDDAIVLAERNGAGEAVLFAFVTCSEGLDEDTLRQKAREAMPGYMVPRHIVVRKSLPRTVNGKLDAEALRPDARALLRGSHAEARQSQPPMPFVVDVVEQHIVAFMRKHVDPAFDPHVKSLQGRLDSLLLIELAQFVEQELGIHVAIARLSARALESTATLAAAILAESGERQLPPKRNVA